jgi:hypothetical protein
MHDNSSSTLSQALIAAENVITLGAMPACSYSMPVQYTYSNAIHERQKVHQNTTRYGDIQTSATTFTLWALITVFQHMDDSNT